MEKTFKDDSVALHFGEVQHDRQPFFALVFAARSAALREFIFGLGLDLEIFPVGIPVAFSLEHLQEEGEGKCLKAQDDQQQPDNSRVI